MRKPSRQSSFPVSDFDKNIAKEIIRYAGMVVKRGWVCNTLGNIAVRKGHPAYPFGTVYTKHKGVSLEEMDLSHIVVTDVRAGNLLYGERQPSIGHQLNRAVFWHRADINAVFHLHVNSAIAYFSVIGARTMKYISDDTALILGKPVYVLEPQINVEKDASSTGSFISETNCFVMPNHGVTTLGRHISEAYHRMCSLVAEVERVTAAGTVAKAFKREISWVPEKVIQEMYGLGEDIIYGNQ